MWNEDEDFSDGLVAEPAEAPMTNVALSAAPQDGGMLSMMVQAAQSLARDQKKLIARAKQIGSLLGESGFYRFPVGGSSVEGESISMAQALAQEWGGVLYQVHIVRSENMASGGRRIHLRASAGDLKSLVCSEVDQVVATTAPPGKFSRSVEQQERWHAMQMQSAASKILRNAILRVLPKWFVAPALKAAKGAANSNLLGGRSLEQARSGAVDALAELGCKLEEIEVFLGQPLDMWAIPQIAQLKTLYRNLKGGAISIAAWRASLTEDDGENGSQSSGVTRSALGLPAQGSGAKTVTEEMGADKKDLEPEPAKAKSKNKGKQESLPGAES